ncbi:MAG: histidinol-phosphate transaminase [Steroidobacteraceae bacterium]
MNAPQRKIEAHPGALAVPAVRALSPYVPGKPITELARELGLTDIIKLASNENPYGTSPQALAAMRTALAETWLYPDGSGHEMKQALAEHLGVSTDTLTLGNGSNDLLVLLAESFLTPQFNAVYAQYGFAYYPLVTRATGAQAREVPALKQESAMPLGHDLDAMARAVDANTRLIFVANPNNPTGTWVSPERLRAFVAAQPATALVVLDEAYVEYGRLLGCQDAAAWVAEFPNLVVLRTFSKAYGLAGLRVGYAISHPEVADVLNRLRPAFNVNTLAQVGATAALRDQTHMLGAVERTVAELRRVQGALQAEGWRCIPSAANFVLVHIGPRAAEVNQQLLRAGIIVRPVGGYGLPEYLRLSIGLPAENDRLLATLSVCKDRRTA